MEQDWKDLYSEGFDMGKMFGAQLEKQQCRKIIEDVPIIKELSYNSYDFLKSVIDDKSYVDSFLQGIEIGLKEKILNKI